MRVKAHMTTVVKRVGGRLRRVRVRVKGHNRRKHSRRGRKR